MGVTTEIINAVQAPRTTIIVAVSRERRVQLEYKLQTTIANMFVDRARNGTKYTLQNQSVIIVQVSGNAKPNIDTIGMKAKEWREWITDAEKDEDAEK